MAGLESRQYGFGLTFGFTFTTNNSKITGGLYFDGGFNRRNSDKILRYNTDDRSWTIVGKMTTGRSSHRVGVVSIPGDCKASKYYIIFSRKSNSRIANVWPAISLSQKQPLRIMPISKISAYLNQHNMPIGHHTNKPSCHHGHPPSQPLRIVMPISHYAYQPSCQSAIMTYHVPSSHLI